MNNRRHMCEKCTVETDKYGNIIGKPDKWKITTYKKLLTRLKDWKRK